MSPLRDNLDRAKADYGQLRYRGNLARDVLGANAIDGSDAVRTANLTINPWPRRVIGIAAALAVSAAAFFAGSYFERRAGMTEVATTTPLKSTPIVAEQPPASEENATQTMVAEAPAAEAADFTLVPSLASASTSSTDTGADTQTVSASQQSMDFSTSVPSSPMLFSLATLAEQETQQTTTDGEEERS